ncbi:MAG: hypothetical protein GDA37_13570, partial [Ekhidna sp.]|nr:hypothetical protein [Ekhidna sp.]
NHFSENFEKQGFEGKPWKDVIKRARWVDTVEFDESKKGANRFDYVLYFEIKIQGKSNYLVVKKEKGGKMLLYSIVEKIK